MSIQEGAGREREKGFGWGASVGPYLATWAGKPVRRQLKEEAQ